MKSRAFTLLELLVAISVTILLVGLLATMSNSTGTMWQRGESQVQAYANARAATDLIGRELQSSIIDLDFGFRIDPVTDQPNNCVLKFLRRKTPGSDLSAVEKVAYQLAWAGTNLLPEVQPNYDSTHPIPVLIRTVNSTDLADVFNITIAGDVDKWSRTWGTLTSPVKTGALQENGDSVEIAADNVLGWKVFPVYWDKIGKQMASDDPLSPVYYGKYLTSEKACPALAFEFMVASPRIAARLSSQPEWANLRKDDTLFDSSAPSDSTFYSQLREHLRHFDASVYLFSRTP